MLLGRVTGHVVSTAKHDQLTALKLLLVQPMDPEGTPRGGELMAADSVGAGVGERVLVVVEGRSASQAVRLPKAPLDAAIVGIVDRIDPV